jgi:hypothetical protein
MLGAMRFLWPLVLASACAVRGSYLVEPADRARLAALPAAERARAAVPAVRADDGRRVWLRASALGGDGTRVDTVERSAMVSWGAALTWIGSAMSTAGTVLFFATGGDARIAGAVLAAAAEPVMGIGAVLWPLGLVRPPPEVRAGRADTLYLPPAP